MSLMLLLWEAPLKAFSSADHQKYLFWGVVLKSYCYKIWRTHTRALMLEFIFSEVEGGFLSVLYRESNYRKAGNVNKLEFSIDEHFEEMKTSN